MKFSFYTDMLRKEVRKCDAFLPGSVVSFDGHSESLIFRGLLYAITRRGVFLPASVMNLSYILLISFLAIPLG